MLRALDLMTEFTVYMCNMCELKMYFVSVCEMKMYLSVHVSGEDVCACELRM